MRSLRFLTSFWSSRSIGLRQCPRHTLPHRRRFVIGTALQALVDAVLRVYAFKTGSCSGAQGIAQCDCNVRQPLRITNPQNRTARHTLLLDRTAGSFFFLGEIYTDLALPPDAPVEEHCGTCFACKDACPTGAIVGPYKVDARRCISYLTIELKGAIPEELRPLIGNRVYGCDDCQLACPWNKFAQTAAEPDFKSVRNGLDDASLLDLFAWSEAEFKQRMAGSAILRIGYAKWLSNIAIALGNALRAAAGAGLEGVNSKNRIHQGLQGRADDESALVRESAAWALARADVPA